MAQRLTLFVYLRVKPVDADKLVVAHKPVWAACAAEPECLLFDVFQEPDDRGRFRFVEVWSKSREWFEQEQLTKSYYEGLWERSKLLWIEDIRIEYMERFGQGCSYRQAYLDGGKKMD
jgi:quinol monooxygenase YgiN